MNRKHLLKCITCVAFPLALIPRLPAQEKTAPANVAPVSSEPVEVLSPFVVTAEEDQGYDAKYTLAGTRIRTDVKDVGSSISIITEKFLQDTASTNATQLLVYTPNTEVVGQGGNYLGIGDGAYAGSVRYGTSRVRGLSTADNTRDFFLTDIPWDSYNTGRIDIQRGPNSILFGIGSPAGIINASVNHAGFKDLNRVENKLDNYGTVRFSGDFNKVLIDNVLAVRVALLDDKTEYRQDPAFRHDQRGYVAGRWDPAFLNKGSMHTTFEVNYEKGNVDSNLPRNAPPNDYLTPWFSTLQSLQATGVPIRVGSTWQNGNDYFRLWQAADQVTQGGTILAYRQGQPTNFNYRENSLDGPYHGDGFLVGIGGYGNYINERGLRPGSTIAAWRNNIIADRSIFDSYNNLLDGDTKAEFNEFHAFNAAFRQSFLHDTLGYEIAFDQQKVHSGEHHFLNDAGYGIAVDTMGTELGGVVGGTPNPAGGTFAEVPDPVNPNLGLPYVVGARGSNFDWSTKEKTTGRFTAFYDLDFKKILGSDSKIAWIFGENRFTGLASQFIDESSSGGGSDYYTNSDFVKIANDNHITYIFDYLTSTKLTGNNPAGLHLPRLTGQPVAQTSNSVQLWDTTNKVWNSTPFSLITNYNLPEEQRTYGSAGKQKRTVNTGAFVWQGYWFDSVVIPMFALRKDESFFNEGGTYDSTGVFTPGAPHTDTVLASNSTDHIVYPFDKTYTFGPKGPTAGVTSRTYSVVTHTPKKWREKLPGNLDIQLIYNQSENFQPQPGRVDIQNRPLPDPSGRTKEYGVAISAMHDKLYLKVVHYETHEENADLGNLANLSALAATEVWARSGASVHAGKQGPIGTGSGNWQADVTYGVSSDGHAVTFKPFGPEAADLQRGNDVWLGKLPNEPFPPGTVRQSYTQAEIDKTWAEQQASIAAILNNPPPDSFIAATGINRTAFFSATGPDMFAYGTGPANAVVTGSTVSKGTELELVANPIAGLSISLNASRTEAQRTSIAQSYLDYLDERRPFFYGPAGDMRIWSSGEADTTLDPYTTQGNASIKVAFRTGVDAPISLFLASEKTKVPELKPWAFNVVANYAFQSDRFKGFHVGGGYRWQDKNIIGYPITQDSFGNETYDVDHPYYGPTEAAVDGWIGYEHKISRRLKWHIQLNVRNLFANDKLIKAQANPDGSGAAYRIPEPRTMTLTNTIEF